MDYKEKILAEILDCGYLDIQMLEDIGYDVGNLIREFVFDTGSLPDMNDLLRTMFEQALDEMGDAIVSKMEECHNDAVTIDPNEDGELYDSYTKEIEELSKLDPCEDIKCFTNCLDTSWYFVKNEAIYAKYLRDTIESLSDKTGFPLECGEQEDEAEEGPNIDDYAQEKAIEYAKDQTYEIAKALILTTDNSSEIISNATKTKELDPIY